MEDWINDKDKKDQYGLICTVYDMLIISFWVLIICGMLTLLFGCKGTERIVEVDREVVKIQKDTVRTYQLDSVYVRDSSWMRIVNDTVWIYKDRWRERLSVKTDTVKTERIDTVKVDKVQTVVEKKKGMVKWWWVLVGMLVGAGGALVCFIKLRK